MEKIVAAWKRLLLVSIVKFIEGPVIASNLNHQKVGAPEANPVGRTTWPQP